MWIQHDSLTASRDLSPHAMGDPMAAILVPQIAGYSSSRGEEITTRQWEEFPAE